MGIFYNPPQVTSYPNIGGQQPLTPGRIAANTATFPTPPPRSSFRPDETRVAINDWWYTFATSPFITLLLDANNEPYEGALRTPPVSGPPQVMFKASQLQVAISDTYYPPNPFVTILLNLISEPYEQAQLAPPSGLPTPVRPNLFIPIQAAYVSWNSPANPFVTILANAYAGPYEQFQGTPPSGGVPASALPGIPQGVLDQYYHPPLVTIVFEDVVLIPITPPPTTGSLVPEPVLISWLDYQKFQWQQITPLSFNPPTVPPPVIGSPVPQAVLDSWIGYQQFQWQQIAFFTFKTTPPTPPPVNGSPVPQTVLNDWLSYQTFQWQQITPFTFKAAAAPSAPPPYSQPINYLIDQYFHPPLVTIVFEDTILVPLSNAPPTTGSLVPEPVLNSWLDYQKFQWQQIFPFTFKAAPPVTPPPPVRPFAPPADEAESVIEIELPSLVVDFFPPINGAEVPESVLIDWADYQKLQVQQRYSVTVQSGVAPTPPPPPPKPLPLPPPPYPYTSPVTPPIADNPSTFPTNPPFVGGAQNPLSDRLWFADYNPPPPTWMGDPQPWTPSQLAQLLPVPTKPPVTGAVVPQAVLNIWNNPPQLVLILDINTQPYQGPLLPPPSGLPTPVTATVIPNAIYVSWFYQPPLVLLMDANTEPFGPAQLPPPSGGTTELFPVSNALQAILNAWNWQTPQYPQVPQPAPQSIQQLVKPQGLPSQLTAILDAWNTPAPFQQTGSLFPQQPPPSPQIPYTNPLLSVYEAWIAQQPASQRSPTAASNPPTFPTPPPIIGSVVPTAIHDAWIPPDDKKFQFQPTTRIAPTIPVPTPPPVIGSRIPIAVLNAWLPTDDKKFDFQPQTNISPTLPIPTPPPIIGSTIAQAILDSWYYEPLPLPEYSGQLTLGPSYIPPEIIFATVSVISWTATVKVNGTEMTMFPAGI